MSPVQNVNYVSGRTFVYKFANIETGSLVGGSNPTLIKNIQGTSGSFNGACGYDSMASRGGIIYSEALISSETEFQLFLSGLFVP